jgi:TatD DNase family protein
MIDLHCHLDLYPDPASVVAECVRRGIYVLSVTTTPSAWARTHELARGTGRIRTAIGLHPQLAKERRHELRQFDEILPQTRYVGEVGMDGTSECLPFWADQVAVFEHVLASCAAAGGRVLTVHTRRAEKEVFNRLEQCPGAGITVLHWFSGSPKLLEQAISLGCWFSVGPAMLRGAKGRDLVSRMPSERVLTETDGPFAMAADRSALPWDVADAVAALAKLWNCSVDESETKVYLNFRALLKAAGDSSTLVQSNG